MANVDILVSPEDAEWTMEIRTSRGVRVGTGKFASSIDLYRVVDVNEMRTILKTRKLTSKGAKFSTPVERSAGPQFASDLKDVVRFGKMWEGSRLEPPLFVLHVNGANRDFLKLWSDLPKGLDHDVWKQMYLDRVTDRMTFTVDAGSFCNTGLGCSVSGFELNDVKDIWAIDGSNLEKMTVKEAALHVKMHDDVLSASTKVSAKDVGRVIPKKFYVVMPFGPDDYSMKAVKDISRGYLDGVQGISDTSEIIMQWYGMARDAILAMDADKLMKLNKLSRVQYTNPEYLVSNGMSALYRIWDKKKDKSGHRGVASNLVDAMMVGTKLKNNLGKDILKEAKEQADRLEKAGHALAAQLKALPFEDESDARRSVYSVTDNQMDKSDMESFLKYSVDKAVYNLRQVAGYYDGLTKKMVDLYLDSDDVVVRTHYAEAAAQAKHAKKGAEDYGWEPNQVEALVSLMAAYKALVDEMLTIQDLKARAYSELESMSADNQLFYALERGGPRSALESDFADKGTDDIKTVKGLAKRIHKVIQAENKYDSKDIPLSSWERALRKALTTIGRTYGSEGEWLVKDKKLKVPPGSTLYISKSDLRPDLEAKRKAGTLEPIDLSMNRQAIENANALDKLVEDSGLERLYKVRRIDKRRFDSARTLWHNKPKSVAAKLMASYVSAHEIFTDESGKFWGNQGAGGVFVAEDTGRILLQKRSPYVNEPGTYGGVGGKIDDDEDPKRALLREIEEETGYRGPMKVEPLYVYEDGTFKFTNFLLRVPTEFEAKDSWESSGHVWVTLEDLPSPLHFGFKALLSHLRRKL